MKPGSNQRDAQITAHLTKSNLSGCHISQKMKNHESDPLHTGHHYIFLSPSPTQTFSHMKIMRYYIHAHLTNLTQEYVVAGNCKYKAEKNIRSTKFRVNILHFWA